MKLITFGELQVGRIFYYGGYSYTKRNENSAISNRGYGVLEISKYEIVNITEEDYDVY